MSDRIEGTLDMATRTYYARSRAFLVTLAGTPVSNEVIVWTAQSITENGESVSFPLDGIASSSQDIAYAQVCERIDKLIQCEEFCGTFLTYWTCYQGFANGQRAEHFAKLRDKHAAWSSLTADDEATRHLGRWLDDVAAYRIAHPTSPHVSQAKLEEPRRHFHILAKIVSIRGREFPARFRNLVRLCGGVTPPGLEVPVDS
jgi:hypothetical protein